MLAEILQLLTFEQSPHGVINASPFGIPAQSEQNELSPPQTPQASQVFPSQSQIWPVEVSEVIQSTGLVVPAQLPQLSSIFPVQSH